MKKVVIFSLQLYGGGVEKYVSTLANILSSDYCVELVLLYDYYDKELFYVDKRVKVIYLSKDYPDKVSLKSLIKNKKFKEAFSEIKRRNDLKIETTLNAKKYLRNIKADYIITTRISINQLINKYLKNKSIIKIATDHNFPSEEKYSKALLKSVESFDYLVLSTNKLTDMYKGKTKKAKCIYMPNSLDKIATKKSKLISKNMISVGRFSPEKGFLDLIDIFKEVNNLDSEIKLYLLGDGYEKAEIVKKIANYNLKGKVIMPGFLVDKDQEKYYLDSSLYVMTSYTEAFGIVLIESMNYGVPCIAFDSASGAEELLKNDIGILIKDRNKMAMTKKIVSLINDKKELKKYAANIEKTISKYYKENIYKDWRKILK